MAAPVLVIGATGEVGEGIVAALIGGGHAVIAAARRAEGLAALAGRLGHPSALRLQAGSLESDEAAAALAAAAGPVGAVVVAVNAQRRPARLADLDTPALAALVAADLFSHYAAARCFLPRLPEEGAFIGIGGGSADFILDGGVAMSMAQAGLRQMYRGLAHERGHGSDAPALRELIIASVVAGRAHGQADPAWVTAREIGEQVRAMIERPAAFPGTVWRIARRDASGHPVVTAEPLASARALPL